MRNASRIPKMPVQLHWTGLGNEEYNNDPLAWHNPPVDPFSIIMRAARYYHDSDVEYVLKPGDLVLIKSSALGKVYLQVTPIAPRYDGTPFIIESDKALDYFLKTNESLESAMKYGLI